MMCQAGMLTLPLLFLVETKERSFFIANIPAVSQIVLFQKVGKVIQHAGLTIGLELIFARLERDNGHEQLNEAHQCVDEEHLNAAGQGDLADKVNEDGILAVCLACRCK